GAAAGSLVADHDDVARYDGAGLHGGERILLAVEDAGRPPVAAARMPGDLDDATLRRQAAPQDRQASRGLDRIAERPDDPLSPGFDRPLRLVADRQAAHGRLGGVQSARLDEAPGEEPRAAGAL